MILLTGGPAKVGPKEKMFGAMRGKLNGATAIQRINTILRQLAGRRVVIVVDGRCSSGKTSFCELVTKGQVKLPFPASRIIYLRGDILDDIFYLIRSNGEIQNNHRVFPQYQWVREQKDHYNIFDPRNATYRFALTKYFELNHGRLFTPEISAVLFDRTLSISDFKAMRQLWRSSGIEVPEMVGLYVKLDNHRHASTFSITDYTCTVEVAKI